MPITYPNSCKGTTAGALRQIKQFGYSSGSKPLFDKKYIGNQVLVMARGAAHFSKKEPCGEFMEALEQTKKLIDENTEAISASTRRMVDMARDANKSMSDVTGKVRDGTDKLSAAIVKLQRSINVQEFERTVKLTEALVSALERLSILEERGMLDKVVRAMRG